MRVCLRWGILPLLLVAVSLWDSDSLRNNIDGRIVKNDAELLSPRKAPKSLVNFYGEAYRSPQNLDFREIDTLGYPKYWHFPAIQMLDGYHIHSKSSLEGSASLRIVRNPPVDAPPAYPGFSLSQVWDVQSWKENALSIDFQAGFESKASASEAKAFLSILAHPKSGRDPSVFRKQIALSKGMESYRIDVVPTEETDWMVCSIMMVGDGDLSLSSLALTTSEAFFSNRISEEGSSTGTMKSLASSNALLSICLLSLSLGLLVSSYRDGRPIIERIYVSTKSTMREWVAGTCFEASNAVWTISQLVLLRIAFSFYFILPLLVSFLSLMFTGLRKSELDLHIWLASRVGLEVKRFDGIAMGNAIDAMKLGTDLILAILVALVWWLFSMRALNFSRLHEFLRMILRYSLFFTLFPYGSAKLFLAQFPKPSGEMLSVTLGKLKPDGLMWIFFGTSDAFNWIAGGLECLACALLLFRRTVFAGSLLALIILANVVVLDYCYGIEVVVFASTMAIQSLVLIGPDASRLVRFLFGTSTVEPATSLPLVRMGWAWFGTRALKIWCVGMFCYATCMMDYRRGSYSKKPQSESIISNSSSTTTIKVSDDATTLANEISETMPRP